MKIKTFILTFLLMMMSSPIIFGQSRADLPVSSYDEIREAIGNASTEPGGDSVVNLRLTSDITGITTPISIKKGISVTIDLYGRTLTSSPDKYLFTNNGNLTIKNSSIYGDGGIETRGIINGENVADGEAEAVLTIESGIIKSNSTAGNLINNHKNGKVNVTGGKFYTTLGSATTFVNRGTMTIGSDKPDAEAVYVKSDTKYTFINYPGATFTIRNTNIYDGREAGKYYISGIASDNGYYTPADALTHGVTIKEEGKDVIFVKAEVRGMPFSSLNEAVEYAQQDYIANNNEAVVDLLYDDELTKTIMIGEDVDNFTINGNNKIVTVPDIDKLPNFSAKIGFSIMADTITINNLIVKSKDCHALYFRKGGSSDGVENAEINNCKIEGWSCVYVSAENATININNSTLIGENVRDNVDANSFGTIAFNANVTKSKINMNGGSVTAKSGEGKAIQAVLTYSSPQSSHSFAGTGFYIDAEMKVEGDNAKYVFFEPEKFESPVTQVRDTPKHAEDLLAEGWATSPVKGAEGKMISVNGYAVATINGVSYTSLADALAEVEEGDVITIIGKNKVEEKGISYNAPEAIEFTITATDDAKHSVKYLNIDGATVNFKNVRNTINALTVGTTDNTAITSKANITGIANITTISGYGKFNLVEANEGDAATMFTTKNVSADVNASGKIAIVKTVNGTSTGKFNMNNVKLDQNTILWGAEIYFDGKENDFGKATLENCSMTINENANVTFSDRESFDNTVKIENGLTVKGDVTIKGKTKVLACRPTFNNANITLENGAWFDQNVYEAIVLEGENSITVGEGSIFGVKYFEADNSDKVTFNVQGEFRLGNKGSLENADVTLEMNPYNINEEGDTFSSPTFESKELEGIKTTTTTGYKITYDGTAYVVVKVGYDGLGEFDHVLNTSTGVSYRTLAEALAEVKDSETLHIARESETGEPKITYPAAGATEYAKVFTITGGAGYKFNDIIFEGEVDVTFKGATIQTMVQAKNGAEVYFEGNNKVSAIVGSVVDIDDETDDEINFTLKNGSSLDMTYGKLCANVNMFGISDISFAKAESQSTYGNNIYMHGVTLSNKTVINGANVKFVEGTNTVIGATFDGGNFNVNAEATVIATAANITSNTTVNGTLNITDANPTLSALTVNGTLNVLKSEENADNTYTFKVNSNYFYLNGTATFDGVNAETGKVIFGVEGAELNVSEGADFVADNAGNNPSMEFNAAATVTVDAKSILTINDNTIVKADNVVMNFYGIVRATGNIEGTPVINMTVLDENGTVTDEEQAETVRFYTDQANLLKGIIVSPASLYGDEDWKITHTSAESGSVTKKVYKFSKTKYVAQFGEVKYEKISAAVTAAIAATPDYTDDNVVTLIKNEIKESISVKKAGSEVIFKVADDIEEVNITGGVTLDNSAKVSFGTNSTRNAEGKTINFTGNLTIDNNDGDGNCQLTIVDGYSIKVADVTNSCNIEVNGNLTASNITNKKNMEVTGELTAAEINNTGADMNFEGESVKVTLTADPKEINGGDVQLKGVKDFNVTLNCDNVTLENTNTSCDITATGKVITKGSTEIEGDIYAAVVELTGEKAEVTVTGSIKATQEVELTATTTTTENIVAENAVVNIKSDSFTSQGNITAASLKIDGKNATVSGSIDVKGDVNLIAENIKFSSLKATGKVNTGSGNSSDRIITGNITSASSVTFDGKNKYSGQIDSKTTVAKTGVLTITDNSSIETLDVEGVLNVNSVLESETLNSSGTVNVTGSTLKSNFLNLYNTSVTTVDEDAELEFGDLKGYHQTITINFNGKVTANGAFVSVPVGASFNMNDHEATFKTSVDNLVIGTNVEGHKVSYNKDKDAQMYRLVNKYVAKIGEKPYETFKEALESIDKGTVEPTVIELLWETGNDPIVMEGYISNKDVVVVPDESNPEEPIMVDWTAGKGLFIGRGPETSDFANDGDATLTFKGIHLDSYCNEHKSNTDIHVSAYNKNNAAAHNGTLIVKDSDIQFTYIQDRHLVELINSDVEFTLPKAMNIGGRPNTETNNWQTGTAEFKVDGKSTLKAKDIYMGYEGIGILDVAEGAEVTADNFYVGAHTETNDIPVGMGKIRSAGDITGSITTTPDHYNIELSGGIYTNVAQQDADLNDLGWIADGYKAYTLAPQQWQVRQVAGNQVYELNKGWNWFSHYNENYNNLQGLSAFEDALANNATIIKNQTNYRQNLGGGVWVGTLNALAPESMFMIQTNEAQTIECKNAPFVDYSNTYITLADGWNWIGYPVNVPLDIEEALKNLTPAKGDIIKGYDGGISQYLDEDYTITNDQGEEETVHITWDAPMTLEPGKGYMYYSIGAKTPFVYNVPVGSKSTTRDNATVAYHWNSEASYPYNMNVIAKVSIDGEVVDGNYEVAAFANGELRGSARPVYVEAFNTYVVYMTIRGEQTEELTFKYYDVNSGKEYKLSNRISYVNDAVIGSTVEPYMLTMNITDIDEATLSDVNIYPNPTTTGVQVNLDATCEKVEIFNALGVKVAEYQNVDSIDAFETAGIYVIRLTNGGEIKHTRLVVR